MLSRQAGGCKIKLNVIKEGIRLTWAIMIFWPYISTRLSKWNDLVYIVIIQLSTNSKFESDLNNLINLDKFVDYAHAEINKAELRSTKLKLEINMIEFRKTHFSRDLIPTYLKSSRLNQAKGKITMLKKSGRQCRFDHFNVTKYP